eukprot:TRINITY_DN21200_c0_g2_i3.p5 TRINITY_DN21200_c0_g2~~TRINITY_DN21200_c0_g2_i3.p5  ORF type:complete len:110 (-),score=12.06 TRINITY_DN21200_c0_g2_i3:1-330(-)
MVLINLGSLEKSKQTIKLFSFTIVVSTSCLDGFFWFINILYARNELLGLDIFFFGLSTFCKLQFQTCKGNIRLQYSVKVRKKKKKKKNKTQINKKKINKKKKQNGRAHV